ncbi:hypothetical protein [Nonomuraea fuscirosea]|uniref:hypothetical protein n=1 Tax=Nonomuraea fuscirosea TaxID=1291556 RepID=UPI00343F0623
MRSSLQLKLTLTAVLGMTSWLFGNLYEAVVISPNWVRDSPAQLARLHGFFTVTSATLYFVPLVMIALVLVWVLWWRNRDSALTRDHRRAGITAVALAALNAYIVSMVLPKLFGADALAHPGDLNAAAWQWNILNVFRMLLTATTAYFLFSAFRKLDRRIGGRRRPDETGGSQESPQH